MAQLSSKPAQFKIDTFLEYETLDFGSSNQFSGNICGLIFTFIGKEKKIIGFIPVAKTDLRRYLPLGKKTLYCYLSAHPISLGVLAELWGLDSRRFTVRIPIRTGDFLLLKKVQTGHGTRLWASAAKLPGCELNLHVAPRLRMSGSIPPFPHTPLWCARGGLLLLSR